jgi:hypothetical protein
MANAFGAVAWEGFRRRMGSVWMMHEAGAVLASNNRGHGCAPDMDDSTPIAFRAGASLAILEIAKVTRIG